jgi:hypothetical protein
VLTNQAVEPLKNDESIEANKRGVLATATCSTVFQALKLLRAFVLRQGGSLPANLIGQFYAEHEDCRDIFKPTLKKCIEEHGSTMAKRKHDGTSSAVKQTILLLWEDGDICVRPSLMKGLQLLHAFVLRQGGSMPAGKMMGRFYAEHEAYRDIFKPTLKKCIEVYGSAMVENDGEHQSRLLWQDGVIRVCASLMKGLQLLHAFVLRQGGSMPAGKMMGRFYAEHNSCRGTFRPTLKKCIEERGTIEVRLDKGFGNYAFSRNSLLLWEDGVIRVNPSIIEGLQLLHAFVLRQGGSLPASLMGQFYAEHEAYRDIFRASPKRLIETCCANLRWCDGSIEVVSDA